MGDNFARENQEVLAISSIIENFIMLKEHLGKSSVLVSCGKLKLFPIVTKRFLNNVSAFILFISWIEVLLILRKKDEE